MIGDEDSLPVLRMREALASGALTRDRLEVAAYLGDPSAREVLGPRAPAAFSLASMQRGGDRRWRRAIRILGHEPAAAAACEIARLALGAYLAGTDPGSEVGALARDAVDALTGWQGDRESDARQAAVGERAGAFCLAVDVGGRLRREAGFSGERLGTVIGRCWGAVLAPDNPRHVRWLGEAAALTCHALGVPEASVWRTVSSVLVPYAIAVGRGAERRAEPGGADDRRGTEAFSDE